MVRADEVNDGPDFFFAWLLVCAVEKFEEVRPCLVEAVAVNFRVQDTLHLLEQTDLQELPGELVDRVKPLHVQLQQVIFLSLLRLVSRRVCDALDDGCLA